LNGQTIAQGNPTYYLFTTNSVPEPETILLALTGLIGLAWVRRKRS
jgi:hypothetical protein